jgi:uncharacterized phiE125 gp8 family phage protein
LNFRSNEDKWVVPGARIGARYNHIYIVENTDNESTVVTEPVTLQEVKDYMRLEGFTPDDDSPSDNFDFDDDLIADLITEGRVWLEKYTGLNLIARTLRVYLLNQAGMIELPGPVTGVIVITKENDEVIDDADYKFIGSDFPKLVTRFETRLQLDYSAGYTNVTIPAGLKTAIKAYVADAYENRGDEQPDKALTERACRKARAYRRVTLWG